MGPQIRPFLLEEPEATLADLRRRLRATEARLNALPQFQTEIDGIRIR